MINTQLPVVQLNGYFLQWFEEKNEKKKPILSLLHPWLHRPLLY